MSERSASFHYQPKLPASERVHYELTSPHIGHRSLVNASNPTMAKRLVADVTNYRLVDAGLDPALNTERFNPKSMDIEREKAKIFICKAHEFFPDGQPNHKKLRRAHDRVAGMFDIHGSEGLVIIRAIDLLILTRQTEADAGTTVLSGLLDAREQGDAAPAVLLIGAGSLSPHYNQLSTAADEDPNSGRNLARRFKGILRLGDKHKPRYWDDVDAEIALSRVEPTAAKPAPARSATTTFQPKSGTVRPEDMVTDAHKTVYGDRKRIGM